MHRPAELDQTLRATAGSLRDFWDTELPRIYHRPFEDLVGGIQPKTKGSPPWTCNSERITYHDIRSNAFHCGGKNDDYIAYDAAYLMPRLNKSFGALTPAVRRPTPSRSERAVRGHRVAGGLLRRCVGRLRADVGQRPGHGRRGGPGQLHPDDPLLRDQPGTAATNPKAHGLGFDRVNAFQTNTSFERADAFRAGLLDSRPACLT